MSDLGGTTPVSIGNTVKPLADIVWLNPVAVQSQANLIRLRDIQRLREAAEREEEAQLEAITANESAQKSGQAGQLQGLLKSLASNEKVASIMNSKQGGSAPATTATPPPPAASSAPPTVPEHIDTIRQRAGVGFVPPGQQRYPVGLEDFGFGPEDDNLPAFQGPPISGMGRDRGLPGYIPEEVGSYDVGIGKSLWPDVPMVPYQGPYAQPQQYRRNYIPY